MNEMRPEYDFSKGVRGVHHEAFWVWTLLALGVTGIFSAILSARGLWNLRTGQPR